ncbi:MAG: energy transducer TonB [Bacteroidales bacterium]|nr:energy transducer TonB [Bacteroidales bacterium]
MRQTFILIAFFLATLTLAAQSNYTPCYTNNMSKGNTAFSQGKYSEARTYYATAKQCAGGNPTEAQKKIAACDAKIKARKEAAEAKKRAEQEAAEAKKRAEEEARKKEEEKMASIMSGIEDDIVMEPEEEFVHEEFVEDVSTYEEDVSDPVYYAEEMPEFPGGQEAMQAFIQKELVYPVVALNYGIQGTVLVRFVVERDGSISDVTPVVSLFEVCDQEAIRVVKAMPKWKPGKNYGKNIRVYLQIPITFRINYPSSAGSKRKRK